MFSFFNCSPVCPRPRLIPGPTGPAGPRGPIGPQGAQGPQGIPGQNATFDSIYAGANLGATVTTNTIIPINYIASTPTTTMSVANNAVNLAPGTYSVSYFVNGSVPSGALSASLYLNGAPLTGETIVSGNEDGIASAMEKTAIINVVSPSTLSLYNTSAETATLSSASLTVNKLA